MGTHANLYLLLDIGSTFNESEIEIRQGVIMRYRYPLCYCGTYSAMIDTVKQWPVLVVLQKLLLFFDSSLVVAGFEI